MSRRKTHGRMTKLTAYDRQRRKERDERRKATGNNRAVRVWARKHVVGSGPPRRSPGG